MSPSDAHATIRAALEKVRHITVRDNPHTFVSESRQEELAAIDAAILWLDTQTTQVAAPDAPQPDWANAPTWAMWWAYNALYLMGCFYKTKPNMDEESGCFVPTSDEQSWHKYELPLGIDWRLTLHPRAATGAQPR